MIKKETLMTKTEVEKDRLLFDGLVKSEKKTVLSILDAE